MLFGGTTMTYGRGKGVVTGTGMQSRFGLLVMPVIEATKALLRRHRQAEMAS